MHVKTADSLLDFDELFKDKPPNFTNGPADFIFNVEMPQRDCEHKKGQGLNRGVSNVEGGGLKGRGVKWRGGEERKTTLCGGVKVERKENEVGGETMRRKIEKVGGDKMADVMEGKV